MISVPLQSENMTDKHQIHASSASGRAFPMRVVHFCRPLHDGP